MSDLTIILIVIVGLWALPLVLLALAIVAIRWDMRRQSGAPAGVVVDARDRFAGRRDIGGGAA
ncbi:MAG: hypothetical protein Q8O56_07440 [Solirubrobacteraceae bacterium]|nr:hypothetical protein [Solirubrobacteraceae bacterium]